MATETVIKSRAAWAAIPSRPRLGKRGNPPKVFSPAGDAQLAITAKPSNRLMIAKTFFLM
jgi:hypothetical protein